MQETMNVSVLLVKQLKEYQLKLEAYRDEYRAAQIDPKLSMDDADYFKGKDHAYSWAAKDLKNLLEFHGLIK
jgi:hypothetical protein